MKRLILATILLAISSTMYVFAAPYGLNTIERDFDRSNDEWLEETDPAFIDANIGGDVSMCIWAKMSSIPADGDQYQLLSKWGLGTTERSWRWSIWGTNKIFFASRSGGATAFNSVALTHDLNRHFHCVVFDISADEVKFYVDGVQNGATQTNVRDIRTDGTGDLRIGSEDADAVSVGTFDGTQDEAMLFATELTVPEIVDLYEQRQQIGCIEGMIGYWHLNSKTGGIEKDTCGNVDFTQDINTVGWTNDTLFIGNIPTGI